MKLDEIIRYAKSNRYGGYYTYERCKQMLNATALPYPKYEKALREIARVLGV